VIDKARLDGYLQATWPPLGPADPGRSEALWWEMTPEERHLAALVCVAARRTRAGPPTTAAELAENGCRS
jgi:hypothetical protein